MRHSVGLAEGLVGLDDADVDADDACCADTADEQ